MEHVEQGEGEAALDLAKFGEGERRLVELVVLEAAFENLVDQLAEVMGSDATE